MRLPLKHNILLILFLILLSDKQLLAQVRTSGQATNLQQNSNVSYDTQGRPFKKNTGNDSLQKRDRFTDSITIYFRYFDSTRNRTIDSSINDFTARFPMPYYYHHLGNMATASESLFFNPLMKAGFDAGFHQFDVYKFTLENTKFFQTTRPYTELAYVIGSKAEQLLSFTHTQNKKSNFNFSLEYRFLNAPGNLKNQNASLNNYRFTSQYQTLNKKYGAQFIFLANKSAASENGGLQDPKKLDSLALNDPYELETRLGKPGTASRSPFNTTVNTGNIYNETTFLLRHHYDIGSKDSLVTDSVTYKLFFPRLRFEHTFRYTTNKYNFFDHFVDSVRYQKFFNYTANNDSLYFKDAWKDVTNEFSIISFPEKTNLSQFVKAGIGLQNLTGEFASGTFQYYNLYVLGEYRNRTRNQVWDIEANGQFYINGTNAGDYAANIRMKRLLGKKLGYLQIGFQNVNRSPSFILDGVSSFPINNRINYGKENIVRLFSLYENPRNGWKLGAEYFAVNNFMYFEKFISANQESTLFNVLHLNAEKKFRLSKYWNWYTEIHLQQTTGDPPVNIPLLLTRNRFAFEGNFSTNLFLSTGLEIKYNSAYYANNYSPFLGQYFVQKDNAISNRPEINAFLHWRIKSLKGFFRVENLNTLNVSNGFSFNQPNFMSNLYPGTALWLHLGIWWSFVN